MIAKGIVLVICGEFRVWRRKVRMATTFQG